MYTHIFGQHTRGLQSVRNYKDINLHFWITNSMAMILSKLQETGKDSEDGCVAVHGGCKELGKT